MDSELVSRAANASGDHRIRCVMLATSIWNNRMRATQFVFVLCSMWLSPANAGTVLITEQEASLPAKRGVAFDSRGITRAPRVELVRPVEVEPAATKQFGGRDEAILMARRRRPETWMHHKTSIK